MIGTTLFGYAGVIVRRKPYHLECAPEGPTSPIFAHEEGILSACCAGCGNALVDVAAEPEIEEFEADCCPTCGEPLEPGYSSAYCSLDCI